MRHHRGQRSAGPFFCCLSALGQASEGDGNMGLRAAEVMWRFTSRPARVFSSGMSNTGAVVLITSASSGFGGLIAETLARKQYHGVATMRDLGGRNAAARELRALAERESLHLDVRELEV